MQPPPIAPASPAEEPSSPGGPGTAPEMGSGGEELRLATHLRTLAQLAPGIAHDLRAPINAMVFNLEVLRETLSRRSDPGSAAHDARLLRYAEVLREELARLHDRLETLFAFLLPAPSRRETLSLATVLHEIEILVLPTARKRQIAVRRDQPDDSLHLPGGTGALREALLQVAVATLSQVASQGSLTLGGEGRPSGVLIRMQGAPPASHPDLAFPAGSDLAVAAAIIESGGGRLRKIDTSVSAEPCVAYEIEFPDSRNPLTVKEP